MTGFQKTYSSASIKSEPDSFEKIVLSNVYRIINLIGEFGKNRDLATLMQVESMIRALDATTALIWWDSNEYKAIRKKIMTEKLTNKVLHENPLKYFFDLIDWYHVIIRYTFPKLNLIPPEETELFSGRD